MELRGEWLVQASGDITFILRGELEYSTIVLLQKKITNLIQENPVRKITLDLFHVDFVGASGISQLVDMLNQLFDGNTPFEVKNVKKEFSQVFKLYQLKNWEKLAQDWEQAQSDNEH